jgi:hypothetical protein
MVCRCSIEPGLQPLVLTAKPAKLFAQAVNVGVEVLVVPLEIFVLSEQPSAEIEKALLVLGWG